MFTKIDMVDSPLLLTNFIEWRHQWRDVTADRFRLEVGVFGAYEYYITISFSCGAVVWGARRDFTIKTYGRGFESGRERFFARQLLHTWYALSEWIRYLESIKNNECKLSCLRD